MGIEAGIRSCSESLSRKGRPPKARPVALLRARMEPELAHHQRVTHPLQKPPHKKPLSSLLEKSDRVAREELPMPRTAASTLSCRGLNVKRELGMRNRPFLLNPPYTFATGFFPEGLEGPSPRW